MRVTTVLALVAIAFLPLAAASPASAQYQPGQMSMSGHGEVSAPPDTAYVTSGVTSQGLTARAALDANTADMTALIAALKAAGIEARDIQTSSFSVNPNYVYSDARDANGYTLPPKIVGYTVTNQVTVRVRNLKILGSVLDQSVTVGANTINGISFTVADPSKLYEQARRLAFGDAKAKAVLYAEAAGVALGTITSISESVGYTPPQPYMMKMAESAASPAPVPVEAGEMVYAIDVSVGWYLKQ